MIEIFEGRLGNGKTYTATCRILAQLARGGHVITNIELCKEGCEFYCADQYKVEICFDDQVKFISDGQIDDFNRHLFPGTQELPSLCVVDEAHLWFNAKDHSAASRKLMDFLTQSRKCFVDVIFITQHSANMNAQFRRLIQFLWRFRDMQHLKLFGFKYPFPQILCLQVDIDGRTIMDKKFVMKDKRVFAAYRTNALLKPLEFAGEGRPRLNLKRVSRKPSSKPLPKLKFSYRAGFTLIFLMLVVSKLVRLVA